MDFPIKNGDFLKNGWNHKKANSTARSEPLAEWHDMFCHYPLVNIQKAMENHHFSWENPLFLWPFSPEGILEIQKTITFFWLFTETLCRSPNGHDFPGQIFSDLFSVWDSPQFPFATLALSSSGSGKFRLRLLHTQRHIGWWLEQRSN